MESGFSIQAIVELDIAWVMSNMDESFNTIRFFEWLVTIAMLCWFMIIGIELKRQESK